MVEEAQVQRLRTSHNTLIKRPMTSMINSNSGIISIQQKEIGFGGQFVKPGSIIGS